LLRHVSGRVSDRQTGGFLGWVGELFAQPRMLHDRSDSRAGLAANALHAYIVTTLVWCVFFFAAIVPFFVVHKVIGSLVGAIMLTVNLISLAMLRRRKVRAACWVLLATSWVLISLVGLMGGGIRGAGLVICPPLIVGAGWLLGKRVALFAAGLFVTEGLTLAILDSRGILPHYLPIPPIVGWSIVVLASGLIVIPLLRVVTAMARLSQALQESEERLRTIFEAAPDAIIIVSLDGRVVEANQAAVQLLGYAREELLELQLEDLVCAEFKTRAARRLAQLWAGVTDFGPASLSARPADSQSYESRSVRKDGTEVPVEVNARRILYAGRPAMMDIARDIGERKRAEQHRLDLERQLERAHRLETLGRLAGGVAHDFNNLLTVINGYSTLIKKLAGPGSVTYAHAEQIRKAGNMAADLTGQLLAFSRQQPVEFQAVDLNHIVEETAAMLQRLVEEPIELSLRLDAEAGAIWGDPGQLQQVLVNLAANARDAMPHGGRLILETASVQKGRGPSGQSPSGQDPIGDLANGAFPDAPADHYVQLTVTDTGAGMDLDTQRRIFEPFFTTKESGRGSGLGLATVYGIVQRCNGRIAVHSELGQGTTFRLLFPCGAAPGDRPPALLDARTAAAEGVRNAVSPGAATHVAQDQAGPGRAPLIFVVEDRDDVRGLVAGMLELESYRVMEFPDAAEALHRAQSRLDPIDLLLTDIAMPDLNGLDLAERLRQSHPETKVLFTSGYADEVLAARGQKTLGAAFLAKPFTADALTAKVREVLGGATVA
jgi:two-component system, cell cycle sensor histidine kinase and response regulator CckA